MISKEQIEKLQNSVDIVDVIGERIDVKRAGSNYKARCPFHDEKTPSFMISHAKQIFKCFGCGAAGDSIKFVMMYDNLSYPDAIRHIASRYGIEIHETYSDRPTDNTADDKKELFRLLNKAACDFFYENLIKEYSKADSAVIKYLKSRKIEKELVDKFRLGFAPDDWQLLKADQRFNKYNEEILVEAGLRKKNEKGNIYDQFRNRLVFPIFDSLGNVAAFSGRTLDDEIQPKYLNSPETVIYKKNQVLYGLYQAMDTIRKTREIILVEGNIDIITMHKFGFTNTVAICGTAFTENHSLLIKRNAERITVLLDGDDAGKKSALKTSEILISSGVIPSIVVLPDGSDPDSYLYSKGKEEFEKLIAKPLSLMGLLLLSYDKANKNANYKFDFIRKIFESLSKITNLSESQEDSLLQEVETVLNIDKKILKRDFSKLIKGRSVRIPDKNNDIKSDYIVKNEDIIEFSIIYLMLTDETSRKGFLSEIKETDFKNNESSRMFLKIYELFEEGEQIKLNNILFDFDEKFKDFMISFILEQEKAFFGEGDKIESEPVREKIEIAYSDNLTKIKVRKISDRMKILKSELKYTSDSLRQNEIFEEMTELKAKQKMLIIK